jgi:predicted ATPase/DNA-binding CsgD family transcriptional regulator
MCELDALVDELVAKFDGARPIEQGEGDSFVAAFALASDAIACALEIQRRLRDLPLRLRIGLHTGEVVVSDGDRYDGPAIIRAARIRDLGHGGQTLLSSTARALVIDAMPHDVGLIDLGPQVLKGLERPERIWQLTHTDIATTFPPLRAEAPTLAGLPVHLSTFIGRTNELEEVRGLVRANRLVTLTGAGGCGKTRLAIEAIREISEDFPDGVWFCDLGPLADPHALAQTVRTTIGLPERPDGNDVAVLLDHLSTRDALLVLDNCEHLITASAELASTLVARCPDLHVVATSREPLGIGGEIAWRVPSLALPEVADAATPHDLSAYDGVALFVVRAKQARPNFALDPTNVADVLEICSRLDGIPLAIELAAARVRVLSVRQIADGLNDRFRLLGRSSRTALERQQTLLASVGWSYDLLTNAQRAALRRLSVFAGGFTLPAAERVASFDGIEQPQVLEIVSQLVDRSLLDAHDRGPEVRYRMLETIRQFSRERLVESGEASDVADRHLEHFTEWAESLFANVGPITDTSTITARIVDDYDNVRAACEWALDEEHYEMGLRLTSALERFWNAHTTAHEGARWLEAFLERTPNATAIERLRGLIALSSAKEYFNDIEPALAAATEALPLARDCGDQDLLLRLLLRFGVLKGFIDPEAGVPYLEEAAQVARATGDDLALVEASFCISEIYMFDNRSLAAARGALSVAVRLGDVVSARPRTSIGFGALFAGEFDVAERELAIAQRVHESIGDEWMAACSQGARGAVALARGDLPQAHRLLDESFGRCVAMGRDDGKSLIGVWCSQLAVAERRLDDAQSFIDCLWLFFTEIPGQVGVACRMLAHATSAQLRLAAGDEVGARRSITAALAEPRSGSVGAYRSRAFDTSARVLRALGEISGAEAAATEGMHLAVEFGIVVSAPDLLETVAALRSDVGSDADAARLFGAAEVAREPLGSVRHHDPIFDARAETTGPRDRLGPQAFDEAWTAGRELTLEDALDFALRGRGPRQRPQAGWDALTPTELKVVSLVAEGLSNPQIAERLFISKRTVSTHLSHVFAKVGVASRAELATEATKRAR